MTTTSPALLPRPPATATLDARSAGPRGEEVITESLTVTVDATAAAVLTALHRLDLTAATTRALGALGLADRIVLSARREPGSHRGVRELRLIWRVGASAPAARIGAASVDGRGSIEVRWRIDARPSGDDPTPLTITTRIIATDDDARVRLLDGWAVLGPVLALMARRMVRTIKAYAEQIEP
jgi:hypothetical protein